MVKAILFFIAAVLLTAVFSYSLQPFLKESFSMLSVKTMLIPCFTWTVLIISSWLMMPRERWLLFINISAIICATGSALLVPFGIYNFLVDDPDVWYSIGGVILSVLTMSAMYYFLLRKNKIHLGWWIAFTLLICLNMYLFYLSTDV